MLLTQSRPNKPSTLKSLGQLYIYSFLTESKSPWTELSHVNIDQFAELFTTSIPPYVLKPGPGLSKLVIDKSFFSLPSKVLKKNHLYKNLKDIKKD